MVGLADMRFVKKDGSEESCEDNEEKKKVLQLGRIKRTCFASRGPESAGDKSREATVTTQPAVIITLYHELNNHTLMHKDEFHGLKANLDVLFRIYG